MMIFKRKQIVVLSLVLMIVVAGYLQYSYKKSGESVSGKDSGRLGEAVYVDNKEISDQAAKDEKDSKDSKDSKDPKNTKDNKDSKSGKDSKATTASKQANDLFAQAKLDREITLGKDRDSLKAITEDKNASKEIRTKAYEQMMRMVANCEKEVRMEALLKEKGFSDVLALFGEDGSLDIVVKAPELTSADTAQIADIASRFAKVEISNIHIKNIF